MSNCTKSALAERVRHLAWLPLLALLACLAGCDSGGDHEEPARAAPAKKVRVGQNVHLEIQGKERRVVIGAYVCLRRGQLELLMCRKNTKEHEAILAAELDARDIHKALIMAGAREGSPVQFAPTYKPARGSRIKVSIRYEAKGRRLTVPAQSWIKEARSGKALASDWVFAGSRLIPNPLDPGKPRYLANDGDIICVSNFETALLDLPIKSPKEDADRVFEAFTDRIPPVNTEVEVILTPYKK